MVEDQIKCECCGNLMDRDAYDAHWTDHQRIGEQNERIERLEAALLIVAAIDDGMAGQVAKKVLNIKARKD